MAEPMNLKTHTAYPEIDIDENHQYTVRLYAQNGTCVFTLNGSGKTRAEALKKARAAIDAEAPNYLKAKGE